jgi:short subunit dehydrogenase-like uncharacterized protein
MPFSVAGSVTEARLLNGTILIYGATGYTGKLIAKTAVDRRVRPILAGRNLGKVQAIAEPLGLSARAFELGDPAHIDAAIKDISVLLSVAGPFSATWRPVADACLRNRVHYLDITGEIDVFGALAARDAEAKARGVTLLPGVGFDVVPSDCLAAHLKRRLFQELASVELAQQRLVDLAAGEVEASKIAIVREASGLELVGR